MTAGRPRLLDLFCCAGGAATGYVNAGFEVVGVDIEDQPDYPYEFHRADALEFRTSCCAARCSAYACTGNRACCNPEHLEAVSRQTNMRRAHHFHANNRRNPTDLNSREIGSILNLVPESVNKLCREGAFDGAYQGGMGGIWFVPEASFDAYMAKRLAETLQAQKARARTTLSNHKPSSELGQGWSITFTQVVERTRYTVADSLEEAIATAQREGVKAHGPTFQILSIDPI